MKRTRRKIRKGRSKPGHSRNKNENIGAKHKGKKD
jgi:hypothetical protein